MKEEWKTLKEFPNYRISNLGRIYRMGRTFIRKLPKKRGIMQGFSKGTLINPFDDCHGYKRVKLTKSCGKRVSKYVHVLVAETFIGPMPTPGMEVDHRGSKEENYVHLLQWVTRKRNMELCHRDNPHIIKNLRPFKNLGQ